MGSKLAQRWVKENRMPLGANKVGLFGAASGGANPTDEVEYLVVAGGGGGGSGTGKAGGGGAGGYRTATGFSVSSGSDITVTVGAGGSTNNNGADSVFSSITSTGGGAGGSATSDGGSAGGSGGGAAELSGSAGSGTSSQGYAGGVGMQGASDELGNFLHYGGGGGGAAEAGGTNNVAGAPQYHGPGKWIGGDGVANSITGSSVTYAQGGSASGFADHTSNPRGGSGDGTANTGKGGGGGDSSNHPGGSGVVIIAYDDQYDDLSSVDSNLTVNGSTGNTSPNTDRSGYKVYRFTAGTGSIQF